MTTVLDVFCAGRYVAGACPGHVCWDCPSHYAISWRHVPGQPSHLDSAEHQGAQAERLSIYEIKETSRYAWHVGRHYLQQDAP